MDRFLYDLTRHGCVYGGPLPGVVPEGVVIVIQRFNGENGLEFGVDTQGGRLKDVLTTETSLYSQAILRDGEVALVVVTLGGDAKDYRAVANSGGKSLVMVVPTELSDKYRQSCKEIANLSGLEECPPLLIGTVKDFIVETERGRKAAAVVATSDDVEAARRRDYGDDGMDGMFDPDRN